MKKINLFLAFFTMSFAAICQVVINEVMPIPGPNSTSAQYQSMWNNGQSAYGYEWVELYNTDPCSAVDLSCYILGADMTFSLSNEGAFAFPSGTNIPPLGFLVIGGPMASNNDFNLYTYLSTNQACGSARWYLANTDGWIGLFDPTGAVIDALFWSSSSANLTTASEYDNNTCTPPSCPGAGTLKKANQMGLGTEIEYAGGNPAMNNSIKRTYDGSSVWSLTGGLGTPGSCNSACITYSFIYTTLSSTQVSCTGNNGTATVTVDSGGVAPYTYQWSTAPVQTNATATGLPANTFFVTVSDTSGCFVVDTVIVSQTSGLTLLASSQNATCSNNDGMAWITITGGTAPFTFLWNNAQSNDTAFSLSQGAYTITVTDNNGCSSSASAIVNNIVPVINITDSTNILCYGNNTGTATVTATGGTIPYTYLWSDTGSQTTSIATALSAGIYTVTVYDNAGCVSVTSVIITEPTALSAPTTSTDASCGSSDGTATVAATGGTPPYSYIWSDLAATTVSSAANLPAGSYTVTVTDNNGCSYSANVIVNNIGAPAADITGSTAIDCYGNNTGSATVTATGGTTPYTYQWNDAGSQTTSIATALNAGSYTVTVYDNTGCLSVTSAIITQPPPIIISSSTVNTCSGLCEGAVNNTVSGGTQPYIYIWSDGATAQNSTGLCTGAYSFTVTDANSCTATGNTAITSLAALPISAGADTTINTGETITLNASPTGAASYNWTPLATLTNSSSQNPLASPLETTEYIVVVTDTNGCSGRDTIKITVIKIEKQLFIPNAFTPGSNKNNIFKIRGSNINHVRFYIYNRWGEMVYYYEGSDIANNGWNGTYRGEKCNPDVFVYHGEVVYTNGSSEDIKGNVTLVR